MNITNYRSAIAATLYALSCTVASAEVLVIVSPKNTIGKLSADQAADLFLGSESAFPGGVQATPIDQTEGSPLRDEFYTKATGKTPAQVKAYRSKMMFTGKGRPPKEADNAAAVKKLVADNPNAIGYIDKGSADSSVKVILTLP